MSSRFTTVAFIENAILVICSFCSIFLFSVLGPANWTTQGDCFPYCSGDQQSPINIDESLVKFSPLLGNFTYSSYELFPDNLTSLELENNGHTGSIHVFCQSHKFWNFV